MANICPVPVHVCYVRATRLDEVGNVDDPPDNSYVGTKPISVQISPNVEAGTDITQKGGCDCILATYQGPDLLKGVNLEFSNGALEPALEEMLLAGTIQTSGPDIVGVWLPGPLDCGEKQPAAAFEFWGDLLIGSATASYPYFHWVLPKTTWQTGQATFENNFSAPPFTGKAVANPLWANGPYGDQPGPVPAASPGGYFFTDDLPTTSNCDYADVTPGS